MATMGAMEPDNKYIILSLLIPIITYIMEPVIIPL